MQIHKFGGASISTSERIEHLPSIISAMKTGNKVFIISALGKTTNALEQVAMQYFNGKKKEAYALLDTIKKNHLDIAQSIFSSGTYNDCKNVLESLFHELALSMEENVNTDYNFYYDQVVSFGELLSSRIVGFYLAEKGFQNIWIDARQVIKTNENFREAGILWEQVNGLIHEKIQPLLLRNHSIVTQGFIGSTLKNKFTTLGREGSDFTAAVFANVLNAASVTIWKDVDGVMNGDPREIKDAVVIAHLDYKEVIEMSYYGAQVIHPKTIKPLQNASIPLHVCSFLNHRLPGTVINEQKPNALPPMIVYKSNQALLSFQTKDFSFIEGRPARMLNEIFANALVKANLTQNTAIMLLVCLDNNEEKKDIILSAAKDFIISVVSNLTLLTIRHYTPWVIQSLTQGKEILLEQRTTETVQILYRD